MSTAPPLNPVVQAVVKALNQLKTNRVVPQMIQHLEDRGHDINTIIPKYMITCTDIPEKATEYWEATWRRAIGDWPEGTGCWSWPVVIPNAGSDSGRHQWFDNEGNRWTSGPYAEARWRLVDHLITWYSEQPRDPSDMSIREMHALLA